MISILPAMSSNQNNGHSNGTRMQDAAASLFRNKILKIVKYKEFITIYSSLYISNV